MPTRRVLKSIAHDVLGTFLSRNNDLDGYWALGQFYAYLERQQLPLVVELDLLQGSVWPDTEAFSRLALAYAKCLGLQLVTRGMPRKRVVAASLRLQFKTALRELPQPTGGTRGAGFRARLEILDDCGHGHVSWRTGCCAPHDPDLERRRANPADDQGVFKGPWC